MLRHTPLHHANMKYFGIKTTLLFLPVEKCGYGSQLASIYSFFFFVFSGDSYFFLSETLPVCVVHSTSVSALVPDFIQLLFSLYSASFLFH